MKKAIAIAAVEDNAFAAAAFSARNSLFLLADFMYGTRERTQLTYAFAIALGLLGAVINGGSSLLQSCPI